MEVLSVKNLNFEYESEKGIEKEGFALRNVSFTADRGEMILVCGPSGCGKTTLFRLLKEEIKPAGSMTGTIRNLYGSGRTGFLFQNPESQIVCQTVEEELAFGAENLGMAPGEIGRSVAEISAYLGIEKILHAKTAELSGGQKQMLNLASILMMKPKILLLDEPVSQLDPVCTCDFISLLRKIREELNITILLTEHNLDAFLGDADRILYMEKGEIRYSGNADGFIGNMMEENRNFKYSLPETVKLFVKNAGGAECHFPLTIRELLQRVKPEQISFPVEADNPDSGKKEKTETAVRVKSGYYRYEKNSPDILKALDLSLEKGKIYALIGGNGAGKSTLFSVLSGYRKLYRGKCTINGTAGVLPQNPVYAFFKDVLYEDYRMLAGEERIGELIEQYEFCRDIKLLFDKNPLDLSGGQMQKAAVFKMLLRESDILLLDEPVKAMDGYEKKLFREMLRQLRDSGKTILFISHDLEFVQSIADRCLMMFDGKMIAEEPPEKMFLDNRFYTTVRGRIGGILRDESDVVH